MNDKKLFNKLFRKQLEDETDEQYNKNITRFFLNDKTKILYWGIIGDNFYGIHFDSGIKTSRSKFKKTYEVFFKELDKENSELFKMIMTDNKTALLNIKHPILGEVALLKVLYKNDIIPQTSLAIYVSEEQEKLIKETNELL